MKILLFSRDKKLIKNWMQKLLAKKEVLQVASAQELEKQLLSSQISIVLYDLNSFSDETENILKKISKNFSDTKVLVLSNNPNFDEGFALLGYGIKGYANSYLSTVHLNEALKSILEGNVWFYPQFVNSLIQKIPASNYVADKKDEIKKRLTKREYEIATLVAKGLSNKEIAYKTGITERTVKAHISSVFEKLDIYDRVTLALKIKELA